MWSFSFARKPCRGALCSSTFFLGIFFSSESFEMVNQLLFSYCDNNIPTNNSKAKGFILVHEFHSIIAGKSWQQKFKGTGLMVPTVTKQRMLEIYAEFMFSVYIVHAPKSEKTNE